jgi:hypothetical protein
MSRRFLIAPALLLAGVAASLPACSVFVVDTDQQQCSQASECVSLGLGNACVGGVCVDEGGSGGGGGGEPTDPKWGCLGNVEWPAPGEDLVTLRVSFRSAVSSTPPTDLSVRYCAALDVNCDNPIASDIPVVDDRVEVQVEAGTRGYFEITSSVEPPTVRPAMLYFPRPASAETTPEDLPVTLVSPGEYNAIVASAGFEDDPTRGTLLSITTDCTGTPTAGARIQSSLEDDGSTVFYFVSLIPEPEATQTDVDGYGGIFNLAPGAGVVESFRASDDQLIGFSSFQVRAGWLSNVAIEPTPVE